jgi:hypothetical protein
VKKKQERQASTVSGLRLPVPALPGQAGGRDTGE